MEVGLLLVTQYDAIRSANDIRNALRSQTAIVREGGFDGVYVGEHHVTDDDQYLYNEAVVAHLADCIGDMWLGTAMCLLPYHNPVRIAEFGATMDLLTDGQFRLGVALGYRQQEYDVFGVSKADAPGRLEEGLEVIKRLWTEDSVTFEGEHFQFEDVSIRPQPVQRPRPDIWVGASNPASVRRAARVGETFLGAHVPFDLAEKQIGAFCDERPADDPGEVGLIRETFVAETAEAAEEAVRDQLMDKYDRYVEWGQDDAIADDRFDSAWERLAYDRFLVGSPEEVAAEIERYQTELGLDHLVIRSQFPGADFTSVEKSLQLFADEVLPEVQ